MPRRPNKNHFVHGMTGTHLHNVWMQMRRRCSDEKSDSYQDYGARGITVCPDWHKEFEPFMRWSLANGYSSNLTIERLDVNGNYEPDNCAWATQTAQQRNRRNSVKLTAFNETKHMYDWVEDVRCVVTVVVLKNRIYRGWCHEKAITTPRKC